jgi:simple sugar transport system ATP-binding protein
VGVAGVEGNGQTELALALAGLARAEAGVIEIAGQDIRGLSVRQIRQLGLSHIPEDRMVHGAAAHTTLYNNLIADRYYKAPYARWGFLRHRTLRRDCDRLLAEYDVKCESGLAHAASLSGGNVQKLVAARECSANPRVLLANQPTRGIDIMAADFVRKKLVALRDTGAAILLISADLDEVLEVSDSILVLHKGRAAVFLEDAAQATPELLGEYMLGLRAGRADDAKN